MTRAVALALARVAGYHADTRAWTRLLIEARVNRPAMRAAYDQGVRARAAGVRCICRECSR